VEERAWHSGVDEDDGAKKGNIGGRSLLWRPGGEGEEEKGRWSPRVRRRMEGKMGKRGGRARRGQRGCGATGAGGGAR
jgi:hypothetical protein